MKRFTDSTRELSFQRPLVPHSGWDYLRATSLVVCAALLHVASVYLTAELFLGEHQLKVGKYLGVLLLCVLLAGLFVVLYALSVMVFVRPKRLLRYLGEGVRWHLFSKERLLFSYPVMLVILLDKSVYSSYKTEISNLVPFWLDHFLHDLDRRIFFGHDPWALLHRLSSAEGVVRAIDFFYHPLWLLLLFCMFLYHALGRHALRARVRFFLCYSIVWAVLGNLLATLLSSAGPCYFTKVTGVVGPYDELMALLASVQPDGVQLNAVHYQERLWNGYVDDVVAYGGGISAMPSMHVATIVLFALSMRGISPAMEKLFFLYAVIIWVGSVYLGWHYATDGVVSALCVVPLWHLSGVLVDRFHPAEPSP